VALAERSRIHIHCIDGIGQMALLYALNEIHHHIEQMLHTVLKLDQHYRVSQS
jgi:hypothetical protein